MKRWEAGMYGVVLGILSAFAVHELVLKPSEDRAAVAAAELAAEKTCTRRGPIYRPRELRYASSALCAADLLRPSERPGAKQHQPVNLAINR